jgi:hypothetical protein
MLYYLTYIISIPRSVDGCCTVGLSVRTIEVHNKGRTSLLEATFGMSDDRCTILALVGFIRYTTAEHQPRLFFQLLTLDRLWESERRVGAAAEGLGCPRSSDRRCL